MNRLRSFSMVVWLLVLLGTAAKAQTRYEIDGVIYGNGAKPLANIAIALENSTRAQIALTFSDNDGRYHFGEVSAGVYYLVVKPNETQFQSAIQRIELIDTGRGANNASSEKIDFVLRPSPPKTGESTAAVVFSQEVPATAEKEYKEGMKYLAKNDKEAAIKHLKKALEVFPTYFLALQQVGLIFVENNDPTQGIAFLRKAAEVNAKSSSVYLGLGIALVNLNQFNEAVSELKKAREYEAKNFNIYLYLGIALLNLGELDSAEKSLKEAYALGGPARASASHLYLASIYNSRKQYREAIDELQAYLRDNPKAANSEKVQQTIAKLKAKL